MPAPTDTPHRASWGSVAVDGSQLASLRASWDAASARPVNGAIRGPPPTAGGGDEGADDLLLGDDAPPRSTSPSHHRAESNAPPSPLFSPTRGTRAPIRTGICSYPRVPSGMSCGVSSRIPDRPSRSRSQTSCVPTPSGVASPMPVTTTRRGGTVGGGWSNPRQATAPSSSPHPRRDDDADDESNLFTAVHVDASSDARARSMDRDDAARTSRSASRVTSPTARDAPLRRVPSTMAWPRVGL
jgi:hypothetical protein